MEWRALGAVQALVDGQPRDLGSRKQRALFALLLSRVGRPVAVQVLLEQLWEGDPPPAAMASLQAYVSNLRRVLEPAWVPRASATVLRTRAPGYLLDSDGVEFDVDRFTGHASAGREALGLADPQRAAREFEAGLALWRGEAYADVRDAAWAAPEVARLEEMRLSVVEARSAALLELGAQEMAVVELEGHVGSHPWRERGCELLALALYRAGRQADALGLLRVTRTRLADELGIDPGPALQRLERDILAQDSVLDWQSPSPVGAAHSPARTVVHVPGPRVPPPVPPQLPKDEELFVGREAALHQLDEELALAAGGHTRLALVAGEPGIGKTRLLRRFVESAGVPVVWGTCPEHVTAPPLWPWEQALRAVRVLYPGRHVPGPVAELLDRQNPGTAEIHDVAGAALRRFEAIGQYLASTCSGPLVVVLDDLHWADMASLRLLAYLADTVEGSALLVVCSFRQHEASALADTLAALARTGATRVALTGLTVEDTTTLVNGMTGRQVSRCTAAQLRTRTEGNPFFLRELAGLLVAEHDPDQPETAPVPPPVREVVLRRIARLPGDAPEMLSVAAVIGQHFDIEILAEVVSAGVETTLEAIDAAVAAGVVVEDEHRLGWFGFTQALVAEALYEAVGRLRRIHRHHRIGKVAARRWAGRDEHAGEIARHWFLAAELDPAIAAQASSYAAVAARAAVARLAPEDAAEFWRQALTAAEMAKGVDRYPLLMGLTTSLYRAGNPCQGTPAFAQAVEVALGDADSGADVDGLVSTAVSALCESNWYPLVGGVQDEQLLELLERALPRLTGPAQRALLLSFLAAARYYDDDPRRRVALSDQALALARTARDDVALARVLYLRALALLGPDYPEQCLAAVAELLRLHPVPPMAAAARVLNSWLLATVGRVPEAAAQLDQVAARNEHTVSPTVRVHLGWARASQLLLAGRWPEAEEMSNATYSRHSRLSFGVEQSTARSLRLLQRWEAAFLTGAGADLVDDLHTAAEVIGTPGVHTVLAMSLVEAGRPAEARAILRRLAPGPKDYRWLYTQCWCLLAAARLGDIARVTRLRTQLLPYRRCACAVSMHVISGSVAYFTGEAALALGDADAALADFSLAIEADQAMGALPWLARAHNAYTRAQRLRFCNQ